MINEVTLDVDGFSSRKSKIEYPYVEVVDINETLPLVVKALESGDIPLVGNYKGVTRMISKIDATAFNLDKILRTQGLILYHKSEDEQIEIRSIVDYLEVV